MAERRLFDSESSSKWRKLYDAAFHTHIHVHVFTRCHRGYARHLDLRAMCTSRDESSGIKGERTRRGEKASMEQREKPTARHELEEEIAERCNARSDDAVAYVRKRREYYLKYLG